MSRLPLVVVDALVPTFMSSSIQTKGANVADMTPHLALLKQMQFVDPKDFYQAFAFEKLKCIAEPLHLWFP